MKILWSVKFVALMTRVERFVNGDTLYRSVRQIFYIASLDPKMMSGSDHVYFARFLSFFFVGVYAGYLLAIELGDRAFVTQSAVVDQHLQSCQTTVTHQVLY